MGHYFCKALTRLKSSLSEHMASIQQLREEEEEGKDKREREEDEEEEEEEEEEEQKSSCIERFKCTVTH